MKPSGALCRSDLHYFCAGMALRTPLSGVNAPLMPPQPLSLLLTPGALPGWLPGQRHDEPPIDGSLKT
jgi:hypothetical protein